MYLLNTSTKRLKEFGGPGEVQYAILSHRWTEEEVTFEDVKDLPSCTKKGVSKVLSFCEIALESGYDWCWIDTCCIDKASSAELSEAINSMFTWYKKSGLCVVYLKDVMTTAITAGTFEAEFRASAWFLRSWTLQELLASVGNKLSYYSTTWSLLGSGHSLATLVSDITTIDEAALLGQKPLSYYCIAERMSWASMRSATRVEDIAYSLLGIFDVQMPLVYGEGPKAFRRLQQAIMTTSDDETIFAWEPAAAAEGPLAQSPSLFASSRYLRYDKPRGSVRKTYELVSRGVRFDCAQYIHANENVHVLLLNVIRQQPSHLEHRYGIHLRGRHDGTGYYRIQVPLAEQLWRGAVMLPIEDRKDGKSFYIPFDCGELDVPHFESKHHSKAVSPNVKAVHGYDLTIVPFGMLQPARSDVTHSGAWLLDSRRGGPICNIIFQPSFHGVLVIHLGIDKDQGRPVYGMLSDTEDDSSAYAPSQMPREAFYDMTMDYCAVQSVERLILPERSNYGKDWHLRVGPPSPLDETSWYQAKLWQHPKEQPDLNYFCPFPFDPIHERGYGKHVVTSHVGWGAELLDVGQGRWKFGLVKYTIVPNLSSDTHKSLFSRMRASRSRSPVECTYSIDLDTFKSVKKFPTMGSLQRASGSWMCCNDTRS